MEYICRRRVATRCEPAGGNASPCSSDCQVLEEAHILTLVPGSHRHGLAQPPWLCPDAEAPSHQQNPHMGWAAALRDIAPAIDTHGYMWGTFGANHQQLPMMQAVNESGRSNEHIGMERASFSGMEAMELDSAESVMRGMESPLEKPPQAHATAGGQKMERQHAWRAFPGPPLALSPHTLDSSSASSLNERSDQGREGCGVLGRGDVALGVAAGSTESDSDRDQNHVRSRDNSKDGELLDSDKDEKPLWEVGKWMFGTSVVLALAFGLFADRERSPVQVILVCGVQV